MSRKASTHIQAGLSVYSIFMPLCTAVCEFLLNKADRSTVFSTSVPSSLPMMQNGTLSTTSFLVLSTGRKFISPSLVLPDTATISQFMPSHSSFTSKAKSTFVVLPASTAKGTTRSITTLPLSGFTNLMRTSPLTVFSLWLAMAEVSTTLSPQRTNLGILGRMVKSF